MNPEDQLPAQYFRAGAGAVILNGRGLVLALERADAPGAWQLPQGGLEEGETQLQAVVREVLEETGILENNLELLETSPRPLVYELPDRFRNERTGRGQVLSWFLFRLKGRDSEPAVIPGREFRAWNWVQFQWLRQQIADFRKPVYEQLWSWWQGYFN